jgi:hypothetical protein
VDIDLANTESIFMIVVSREKPARHFEIMRRNQCASLAVLLCFLCSFCFAGESICSITPPPTPYKLSVCTMIFNEARYIEEWLAYHLLLKVDHFFIYNDGSTDNIHEVLAPSINAGLFVPF